MLKSDIIKRYPWFEKESYQMEVFKIAATLGMDIKDVLDTLDIMLGKNHRQSNGKKTQDIACLSIKKVDVNQESSVKAA